MSKTYPTLASVNKTRGTPLLDPVDVLMHVSPWRPTVSDTVLKLVHLTASRKTGTKKGRYLICCVRFPFVLCELPNGHSWGGRILPLAKSGENTLLDV